MPSLLLSHAVYSAGEVKQVFESFDKKNRMDVKNQIHQYPYWLYEAWPVNKLESVQWYLDPDEKHVTQILTCKGSACSLGDVVVQYENLFDDLQAEFPWFTRKIDGMIAWVSHPASIVPPVIIGACRNSNQFYVIDGVHRSLSYLIHRNRSRGSSTLVKAYVGYKMGLSIVKKFLRLNARRGINLIG